VAIASRTSSIATDAVALHKVVLKRLRPNSKVFGLVKKAADNDPVGRMSIKIHGGGVKRSTFSDSAGRFAVSLPRGLKYKVDVAKKGYVTAHTSFHVKRKVQSLHVPVTPEMPKGEMRVVLGWGKTPSDLDLHVLVPDKKKGLDDEDMAGRSDGEDRASHHEISWQGTGRANVAPYALLENDQTNGYGPETIHTYKSMKGVYYIFVDCFSTPAYNIFQHSHAYVNIFSGAHQIFHGSISKAKGTPAKYWHALNLDCRKVVDGHCKVVPVNRFTSEAPQPGNMRMAAIRVAAGLANDVATAVEAKAAALAAAEKEKVVIARDQKKVKLLKIQEAKAAALAEAKLGAEAFSGKAWVKKMEIPPPLKKMKKLKKVKKVQKVKKKAKKVKVVKKVKKKGLSEAIAVTPLKDSEGRMVEEEEKGAEAAANEAQKLKAEAVITQKEKERQQLLAAATEKMWAD
jgi:uncharacterized protein YfaP (DUF2135 family)